MELIKKNKKYLCHKCNKETSQVSMVVVDKEVKWYCSNCYYQSKNKV